MGARKPTGQLPAVLVLLVLTVAAQNPGANKGTLQGVVTDPIGAVIPKATVTLYSVDGILQTQTDARGQFRFVDLPLGRYTLEVSSLGFKPYVQEGLRILAKSQAPLAIELFAANTGECREWYPKAVYVREDPGRANLRGIVRATNQEAVPLANARLSLSSKGSEKVLATQTTNEKGEFQFEAVAPGQYVLAVSADGYNDSRTEPFWIIKSTLTRIEVPLLEKGFVIICQ